MGKLKHSVLILGEGPTEFYYFKLFIMPNIQWMRNWQITEITPTQNLVE